MIGSGIKRGTAELAVLSVLQDAPLHGYELARRIEQQTNGALRFTLAALYPMLYRMEQQRWIRGTWETSANGRRRRCYRLTPAGKKKLSPLQREWAELFRAATAHEGGSCLIGKNSFAGASPALRWKPVRRTKSTRSWQPTWKSRMRRSRKRACLKKMPPIARSRRLPTGEICSERFLSQGGEDISCRNGCTSSGFPGSSR